jgi:hypothetical protein
LDNRSDVPSFAEQQIKPSGLKDPERNREETIAETIFPAPINANFEPLTIEYFTSVSSSCLGLYSSC